MSATAVKEDKKPVKDHRTRTHRFSRLPVKDVLCIRMNELGIRNVDMQLALGYAKPNVIAMIKSGTMRLPEEKALLAAKVLELDPVDLLGKVISENDPKLWDAIKSVMGRQLVSANELALIEHIRAELDGFDADLTTKPVVMQALLPSLHAVRDREEALAKAGVERAKRETKPGPAAGLLRGANKIDNA